MVSSGRASGFCGKTDFTAQSITPRFVAGREGSSVPTPLRRTALARAPTLPTIDADLSTLRGDGIMSKLASRHVLAFAAALAILCAGCASAPPDGSPRSPAQLKAQQRAVQ
jgi:hypothetical protein